MHLWEKLDCLMIIFWNFSIRLFEIVVVKGGRSLLEIQQQSPKKVSISGTISSWHFWCIMICDIIDVWECSCHELRLNSMICSFLYFIFFLLSHILLAEEICYTIKLHNWLEFRAATYVNMQLLLYLLSHPSDMHCKQ